MKADVPDPFAQRGVSEIGVRRREQSEFCAEQGRVTGGDDSVQRHLQQADPSRASPVDVVAESAGEVNLIDVLQRGAQLGCQEPQSGGDGALGQLQFTNVRLGEADRRRQCPVRAVSEPAVRPDPGQVQAASGCIDQAATADPAGIGPAKDLAFDLVAQHANGGDGTGGSAHPAGDPGPFERGTGGGGGTNQPVPVTHDDFAVRAEIQEGGQSLCCVQAGR